jgi:hypothetical protein
MTNRILSVSEITDIMIRNPRRKKLRELIVEHKGNRKEIRAWMLLFDCLLVHNLNRIGRANFNGPRSGPA